VGRFAADGRGSRRLPKRRAQRALFERRAAPRHEVGEVTGRSGLDGRLKRRQHRDFHAHPGLAVDGTQSAEAVDHEVNGLGPRRRYDPWIERTARA